MRQITAPQLHDLLAGTDQPPLLLDVREPWEFELARIEGSQLLPLGQVPVRLDELDPARETVVICHHGVRSMQAAFFLQSRGFKNVINLAGGIDAWSREVDPKVPVY
ncbi:MAG: sulfurtransferase [Chromatiales bacterium]|nr:sulfurtransferase [Chromatiales bacterium]